MGREEGRGKKARGGERKTKAGRLDEKGKRQKCDSFAHFPSLLVFFFIVKALQYLHMPLGIQLKGFRLKISFYLAHPLSLGPVHYP